TVLGIDEVEKKAHARVDVAEASAKKALQERSNAIVKGTKACIDAVSKESRDHVDSRLLDAERRAAERFDAGRKDAAMKLAAVAKRCMESFELLRSSMSRISVIEEKVASASDGKSPASGSAPVDGATRDAVLKLRKLVAEIGDRVTRSENAIAKDKLDLLKLREVVGTALKKQKSEVETVMSSQESAKRKEEDSTKLFETLKERDRLVAAEVEVLRGKVEEMSKCLRESAEH
ncbi:unnamed protein product, partial [Effrenium voratum]